MQLVLYADFNKKANSTKRPDGGTRITVEAYLKENTSLESPTFIIQGVNLNINYCFLVDIGHYYFVDDIVITNKNIYELVCSQDVLATYKNEIGNYTAYIERSASLYSNDIINTDISAGQPVIDTKQATTSIEWINSEVGCYAVRLIGRGGTVRTYARTYLHDFDNILDPDIVTSLLEEDFKELGALVFDASSYIVGAYWVPMAYAYLPAEPQDIYIKYYNSGVRGVPLSGYRVINDLVINKPTRYYNDFRAYHPNFTTYTLYLPAVGVVPIASDLVNKTLSVSIRLDMTNGAIVYGLKANGVLVATYEGMLYAEIPLGNSSQDIKTSMASTLTTVGAIASGNIPMAVAGAVDSIQNIIAPTPSVSGNFASGAMLKMFPEIILSQQVHGSGDKPTVVAGAPLCENRKINTLSGFIKCGNASIDIAGLGKDKEEVNGYLNTGFYYE